MSTAAKTQVSRHTTNWLLLEALCSSVRTRKTQGAVLWSAPIGTALSRCKLAQGLVRYARGRQQPPDANAFRSESVQSDCDSRCGDVDGLIVTLQKMLTHSLVGELLASCRKNLFQCSALASAVVCCVVCVLCVLCVVCCVLRPFKEIHGYSCRFDIRSTAQKSHYVNNIRGHHKRKRPRQKQ